MNKPRVVVVSGPTCTGKSTLARAIADHLGATLLSQDEILSEMIPDSDRNVHHRRLSYEELFTRAKHEYAEGEDLVLEGTFSRPEYRGGVSLVVSDAEAVVFELRVPVGVALERFSQRSEHPAIDLTAEIVCARNIDYPYSNTAENLDGRMPTSVLLSAALRKINSGVTTDLASWRNASVQHSPLERGIQFSFPRF